LPGLTRLRAEALRRAKARHPSDAATAELPHGCAGQARAWRKTLGIRGRL